MGSIAQACAMKGPNAGQAGIRPAVLDQGPWNFAREISRYITNASTVRVRTLERYGSAPSVETIRKMIAEHKERVEAYRRMLGAESEAADFVVRSLASDRPLRVYPSGHKYEPVRVELAPAPETDLSVRNHRELIAAVAQAFGLTFEDMCGGRRFAKIVAARAVAARLLSERGNSNGQIGKFLGGMDGSSVLHLLQTYETRATRFPAMNAAYARLSEAAG